MGLRVLLAGQDITDYVDESSISFKSVLGQGTGTGGSGTGASSQAAFIADIGPIKSALGAGQEIPPVTRNLFSQNQSSHENPVDTTEWGGIAYTINCGPGGGISRDTAKAWTGSSALKVVLGGVGTFESLGINIPVSELVPGETYTISAYMLATAGQTPNLRFFIEGNDGITGNHAISATTLHATPVSGQWTRYQVTATMPAVFSDSYIGLRLDTGGTAQAITFWMDGLQFEQFGSATPWHLGRTTPVPALVRGGEVTIQDATGTLVFGGYVSNLKDASTQVLVKTQLDCVDYFQFLDRTEVNEVFTGDTDIDIIRFIITNYAPDILLDDIPASGTYSFTKRYVRAKTIKEALTAIAKVTGFAVWVTPDKRLQYKAPTEVSTAPFFLSDNPDFVNSFGYDIDDHNLDEEGTINRVYFYGGKKSSDDFDQDLSVQANGSNKVFQLAYYPHDSSDGKVHIFKNSVDLQIGSPFSTSPNDKLKSEGGTSDVLLNRDAMTATFDVAPVDTDTLIARYRYSTPLVVVVSDRSSFQFYGKWYDGKMDDQTVLDSSTAIQRARVLLSQQSYGLESLKVITHQGGLQAGMLLKVVNDLRAISDTYLVQSVDAKPLGAGYFEYSVSMGAWNWNLVDLLFAVARRAGVQDDSTEEDTSVVQAQETLEASNIAIVINLTTHTTGQYYSGNFYSGFATVSS